MDFKKISKLRAATFLLLFLFLFSQSAPASVFQPSSWTVKKESYWEKSGSKLGFGFMNFATGWLSLFFEPVQEGGFFKGLARGVVYTITNEAGGAIHAVTFLIPVDIPLPNGGVQFYTEADK